MTRLIETSACSLEDHLFESVTEEYGQTFFKSSDTLFVIRTNKNSYADDVYHTKTEGDLNDLIGCKILESEVDTGEFYDDKYFETIFTIKSENGVVKIHYQGENLSEEYSETGEIYRHEG